MNTAITLFRWLIRITGLFQVILGVLFWVNHDNALVPAHILVGSVLVLSLWVMAVLAARKGVERKWTIVAVVWGLIVLVLGLTQTQLLPGPAHWVVQGFHLIIGLGAIGQGEGLASRIRKREA